MDHCHKCGEDEFKACLMITINKEWWCLDCVRKRLVVKAEAPQVRVGVATILFNGKGEILFGLRKGSHGAGTWSFPGGHVDFGESPRTTVYRELKEETGLDVALVAVYRQCPWASSHWPDDDKQYVTLFFSAHYIGGEVQVMEPDKCVEWKWFPIDKWPKPLFGSLADPIVRHMLAHDARETVCEWCTERPRRETSCFCSDGCRDLRNAANCYGCEECNDPTNKDRTHRHVP